MGIKKEIHFFNYNPVRVVLFIVLFLLIDTCALAQGDLHIFPRRIVFEGRNRVKQVILSNTAKDSATYNISFVQYRMTETGDFERIIEPDSGQRFATPFLRVYPRRVNLAAGESQTVKVQVINADKLEEGEYRSHLYFRAEKNNKPLGQDIKEKETKGISVKLDAVFGISIATIIRKGNSNNIVSISDVGYTHEEGSNHFLNFNINRYGNMSTYGDITLKFVSGNDQVFEVGKAKGVAVYTPGNVRKVKMLLHKPKGVNFSAGKFEVFYTANESKKIIAQAELEL